MSRCFRKLLFFKLFYVFGDFRLFIRWKLDGWSFTGGKSRIEEESKGRQHRLTDFWMHSDLRDTLGLGSVCIRGGREWTKMERPWWRQRGRETSRPAPVISSDISNPFHNDPSPTPIQSNTTESDTTDGIILLWLTLYTAAAVRELGKLSRWSVMHAGKLHRTYRTNRNSTSSTLISYSSKCQKMKTNVTRDSVYNDVTLKKSTNYKFRIFIWWISFIITFLID